MSALGVCVCSQGRCLLPRGVCSWGVFARGGVCSGGCLLGGQLLGGVCSRGWYPSMHWDRHPPPCGQTHACKNITFATSLRTVNMTLYRFRCCVMPERSSSKVMRSAFYISRHNFQMELGLLTHIQNRQVELGETFEPLICTDRSVNAAYSDVSNYSWFVCSSTGSQVDCKSAVSNVDSGLQSPWINASPNGQYWYRKVLVPIKYLQCLLILKFHGKYGTILLLSEEQYLIQETQWRSGSSNIRCYLIVFNCCCTIEMVQRMSFF